MSTPSLDVLNAVSRRRFLVAVAATIAGAACSPAQPAAPTSVATKAAAPATAASPTAAPTTAPAPTAVAAAKPATAPAATSAPAATTAPAAASSSSYIPSGKYGSQTSVTTPKQGGTLIYGMEGPTDILDPQATSCWLTYRLTYQLFEGFYTEDLTRIDQQAPPIVGQLIESADLSSDGLVRTFKLRSGVKFHDGTPFDAAAAVWNWERMYKKDAPQFYARANSYCSYIVDVIKNVEAVDDKTVKMTFTTPFSEWERMTVQSFAEPLMISPKAVQQYGNEGFAQHPVGTGPYRFVENVPNDHVTFERNPDYWGKPGNFDRLIFRQLDDPAARVAALRKGEADIILAPPPDEVPKLQQEGFQVLASHAPHIWYFYLNLKNEQFKDLKVRQAIQMSVDRDRMASELLKGTASAAYSSISPATEAFDPTYKPFKYDPAGAKQLLAQAGYPNGFKTVLETSTAGSGQMIPVQMVEWIQRDLKQVGIDAEIRTYEWVAYLAKQFKGLADDVGGAQLSWGMTTNFWFDIIARSTRIPPNGTNINYYANKQVDDLLDKARAELDATKRNGYYKQIDKFLTETDAAFWPIVNDLNIIVLGKNIGGFVNPPEEWFQLSTPYAEG